MECLAFYDYHQWKSNKIHARKEKNRVEERKKNEEQLREKNLIVKLAQQVSKSVFVQNEVTN